MFFAHNLGGLALVLFAAVSSASPAPLAQPEANPGLGNGFWQTLSPGGQPDWSQWSAPSGFISGLRSMCGSLPYPVTIPNGCTPSQAYEIVENNEYMCSFFQCSDSFSITGITRTSLSGGGSSSSSGGGIGGDWGDGSNDGGSTECNCPEQPPTTVTVYKTKTYKYVTTSTCYSTLTQYYQEPSPTPY